MLTGLRIYEELLEVDYLVWNHFFLLLYVNDMVLLCLGVVLNLFGLLLQPRSCSRAMKAVGVVEGTCEEIFELVMSMDGTRFE